jgi:hypothetical protein
MDIYEMLKQKIQEAYGERPITFILCVFVEELHRLQNQIELLKKEIDETRK